MENIIRIQAKVDTAEQWTKNNPILLNKEIGYVRETGQYKIGDNIHTWNQLPFAISSETAVFHTIENEDGMAGLSNTIPADKERHIIIYKNVPYFDANTAPTGTPKTTTIYVEKMGDGKTQLVDTIDSDYEVLTKGLPCLSTVVCGTDGESSVIQISENEMYKYNTKNGTARSTATGKASVALGRYNKVYGDNSAALNYNNSVYGETSLAIGKSNIIKATYEKEIQNSDGSITTTTLPVEYAFVGGISNEVQSTGQFVIGDYADTEVNDAFVIGNGSKQQDGNAKRQNAFKVTKNGEVYSNTINTENTFTKTLKTDSLSASTDTSLQNTHIWQNLNVDGDSEFNKAQAKTLKTESLSVSAGTSLQNTKIWKNLEIVGGATIGNSLTATSGKIGSGIITGTHTDYGANSVSANGSSAIGGNNKVYGRLSSAFITSNTIPEDCPFCFIAGRSNTATAARQTIFGDFADPQTTDAFVIGNGNTSNRKNALAVGFNGDIRIGGTKLTLGSTSLTESELKNIKTGNAGLNFYVGSTEPSRPQIGMLWFEV